MRPQCCWRNASTDRKSRPLVTSPRRLWSQCSPFVCLSGFKLDYVKILPARCSGNLVERCSMYRSDGWFRFTLRQYQFICLLQTIAISSRFRHPCEVRTLRTAPPSDRGVKSTIAHSLTNSIAVHCYQQSKPSDQSVFIYSILSPVIILFIHPHWAENM